MNYVSLSHSLSPAIPVYPGDPRLEVAQRNSISKDGFEINAVTCGMHVGTHIDAPRHFIENGRNISEYPVSKFFGRGVLLDCRDMAVISSNVLKQATISPGDILLLNTDWDKHFGADTYFTESPIIDSSFAQECVALGVSLVGMDLPTPDRAPYDTHKILLSNDILIIENLTNLSSLKNIAEFNVVSLPVLFETEAAPANVVAAY